MVFTRKHIDPSNYCHGNEIGFVRFKISFLSTLHTFKLVKKFRNCNTASQDLQTCRNSFDGGSEIIMLSVNGSAGLQIQRSIVRSTICSYKTNSVLDNNVPLCFGI